jgi:hypothetical protein
VSKYSKKARANPGLSDKPFVEKAEMIWITFLEISGSYSISAKHL